jgi:hypothetical protein
MPIDTLTHPDRDMLMELLCLLPRYPLRARFSDLLVDLQTDRRELGILVRQLSKQFNVRKYDTHVALGIPTWESAQAAGMEYLQKLEKLAVVL